MYRYLCAYPIKASNISMATTTTTKSWERKQFLILIWFHNSASHYKITCSLTFPPLYHQAAIFTQLDLRQI